jgi:putative phosphoesterase
MKIGILSDTHGRVDTVALALAEFRARRAELLIHCGDIDDAETVAAFAGWNVHFVYGNCDADRRGIKRAIAAIGGTLHDPFGHLELDGKQIAWLHGDRPDLMHDVEASGHYDYLFYGHTHAAEQHRTANTLVVNPGALFRARPKSCLVLDLTNGRQDPVVISGKV